MSSLPDADARHRWRVGIDTGGTFADVVAWSPAGGALHTAKLPRDAGADELAAAVAELAGGPQPLVIHGTTQITNALLEGSFARTALVTTRGFGDVLRIARQARDHLYDLGSRARAEPVVPRELTFELDERCAPDGAVVRPLRDAQLQELRAWLAAEHVESIAICLLHAYANPEHERRVGAALPGALAVSLSHEVGGEAREYERAAATALNAAVQGAAQRYLGALAAALDRALPGAPLFVVQSTGAMTPASAAARRPLTTVMSGPAAGVAAVSQLARRRALRHAVAFDMGGTSTDVALIVGGTPAIARSREVAGRVIRIPSVDVESVAVGGGSIIAVDDVGALTVGPRSAGSLPGPASFGRGGMAPTITDAALLCGLIGAGGAIPGVTLRRELAETALAAVAAPLGLAAVDLAWRAVDVAQSLMSRALSNTVTRRGYDLRDCTLVAYGGGGPAHAGPLAARLGISRVLVPSLAPVLSALGCCLAEVGVDAIRTARAELADESLAGLAAAVASLAAEEAERLGMPAASLGVERSLELRYVGQNSGLLISWPQGLGAQGLAASFHAAHLREYGFATEDGIESLAVACRLHVAGGHDWPAAPADPVHAGVRQTTIALPGGAQREVPVVPLRELSRSRRLDGPAILATRFSSVTVWVGQRASIDGDGTIVIEAR